MVDTPVSKVDVPVGKMDTPATIFFCGSTVFFQISDELLPNQRQTYFVIVSDAISDRFLTY